MSYELPSLANWNQTRDSIQKISHLIKYFQVLFQDKRPLSLEHAVKVYPKGVYTEFGEKRKLYYNYAQEKLTFKADKEIYFSFSTQDKSIQQIKTELTKDLSDSGINLSPDEAKFSDSQQLIIENSMAKDIAKTCWKLYSALARVKGDIFGSTSPIVLWTHHFDIAFLYFSTDKLTTSDPTIAFGFAPYSEGIDRPYAYTYAWDGSAYVDLDESCLYPKSVWWTKGWKGTMYSYDDMLTEKDPIKQFEQFMKTNFELFKKKL